MVRFNEIKGELNMNINSLNMLKKQVLGTLGEQIDQGAKSRLIITIESLMIDLNEEIFAISEELAETYSGVGYNERLMQKAREFEHRKQ